MSFLKKSCFPIIDSTHVPVSNVRFKNRFPSLSIFAKPWNPVKTEGLSSNRILSLMFIEIRTFKLGDDIELSIFNTFFKKIFENSIFAENRATRHVTEQFYDDRKTRVGLLLKWNSAEYYGAPVRNFTVDYLAESGNQRKLVKAHPPAAKLSIQQ